MNNNIIETINNKIDGILNAAKQEIAELEAKLLEAQSEMSKARHCMESAVDSADASVYHAAKQDETIAATAVEMYNRRLSQLASKELVSDEENATTVAAIHAEQKKLADDTTQEILVHLREIEKLGKAYYEQQDALNNLLVRWHQNIYKQPHPRVSRLPVYASDLHYQDSDLRYCIRSLVTLWFYRKKTGREQYHGIGSIWE